MNYDIIHIAGKPHVLVPLHDFTILKNGTAGNIFPEYIQNALTLKQKHPIQVIRKFRGMTQDDLANLAGLSRPYITEIETGRKEGSIRAIKSIATALNVSMEMLI